MYAQCELSEEPGYVIYSTMGSYYVPLIVMVLVYFKIYLAARGRARRNLRKGPSNTYYCCSSSRKTLTTEARIHSFKS